MKSKALQAVATRHSATIAPGGTGALQQDPVHHAGPWCDDLHARIAARAYELYVQSGYRDGAAMEHWLQAERDMVSRELSVSSEMGNGAAR
jgi:hypothetical protein